MPFGYTSGLLKHVSEVITWYVEAGSSADAESGRRASAVEEHETSLESGPHKD